jgi:adenylate kinase family enzyme
MTIPRRLRRTHRRPRYVIETDYPLTIDQAEDLRREWDRARRNHRWPLILSGCTIKEIHP